MQMAFIGFYRDAGPPRHFLSCFLVVCSLPCWSSIPKAASAYEYRASGNSITISTADRVDPSVALSNTSWTMGSTPPSLITEASISSIIGRSPSLRGTIRPAFDAYATLTKTYPMPASPQRLMKRQRADVERDDGSSSAPSSHCGVRGYRRPDGTKIFGGAVARQGDFPWQVFLVNDDSQMCGGGLISDAWILTAAHCIARPSKNEPVTDVVVIAGVTNPQDNGAIVSRAVEWRLHPGYDPDTIVHDIGVIRIPSLKGRMRNFMPICLPSADMEDESVPAVTAGWGMTGPGSDASSVLRYINTTTLGFKACRRAWGVQLTDEMLCTDDSSGHSACQGDSGGPLIREVNGVNHVIGLTSFGRPTCGDPFPGVFTRVRRYLDYICKETQACCQCDLRSSPLLLGTTVAVTCWLLDLFINSC